jgi:hypothetical protein
VNSLIIFLVLLFAVCIILMVPALVLQYTPRYGRAAIVDCAKAVLVCAALAGLAGRLIAFALYCWDRLGVPNRAQDAARFARKYLR